MAAWAADGKIDALYWLLTSSLGTAVTTFVGQNFGAGNYKRVRQCVWQSTLLLVLITLLFAVPVWFFCPALFAIFTEDPEVIRIGVVMARYFCSVYLTYVLIEILSGTLIGMGDALIPTIITILGVCVLRIVWCAVFVPRIGSIQSVMFSYPLTWTVTSAAFLVYYLAVIRRFQRRHPAI